MQSILIKDTTREQRIQIVNKALNVCGSECEFCNGCDNLGGGLTDTFYQPTSMVRRKSPNSMPSIVRITFTEKLRRSPTFAKKNHVTSC